MDFSEVIGQEETKQRLLKMAKDKHVPHALLFCGPYGSGKMALAMSFASYLLETSSTSPEKAKSMLKRWEHPDLHFTYPTIKLPNTSSDYQPTSNDFAKEWHKMIMEEGAYFDISKWMNEMGATTQQAIITAAESDNISRQLSLKSSQGGYKVSIIWLPERMNLTSANKILKVLEEPTEGTIFLMVSEEPEKLLETIISRTQRIDVKRVEDEAIEKALIAQRGLDIDVAHRIARRARGSWLNAIDELKSNKETEEFLQLFQQLMRACYARAIKALKQWSETVYAFGREKQRRMLVYFQQQVRENFMFNFRNPALVYMSLEEEEFAKKFSRFINEKNVIEINELFQKCYKAIGQNANGKIVFYDMTLKLIVLLLRK
ncbi:DNA polymerase III subunit gamma/tau [uncultured Prevotella sp.]|uniref:DNA polymerase III subunit n=1 Tax=uncultured Prevotella sp. TaxID=159272 RepID=UPI001A418AFD|nr:DNA polymerase III subunit delta [uncultured Prevotella sp.]VTY13287.1 DNA polymerase III subunit gamma/tau [uncultured Prevotella sp.]